MIHAFVSSTLDLVDLKEHRAYVIGRLTAAGIFADTMEKWMAASDEPKELSMSRVKDCHLCILLVGFHLGHVPMGEKRSITRLAGGPRRVARVCRVAGFNLPRPAGRSRFHDLQGADVAELAGIECSHG